MSGPKTSVYTLTAEQRRLLAEQRQLQRRKAVAAERIKQSTKRLRQIGGMFGAEKQTASELAARTGSDNGFSGLASELDALLLQIQPIVAETDYDDAASAEKTAGMVQERLARAERLAGEMAAIALGNEQKFRTALSAAIDEGFAASFAEIPAADEPGISGVISEAEQRLMAARTSMGLPGTLAAEMDEAARKLSEITDEGFAKNFIALCVDPLLRRAKQYAEDHALYHEEFEALYAEYTALCRLYCCAAQEYTCSAEAVSTLRAETARIKAAAAEDDEQTYISECLDEIMSEMGYAVIGRREVTKKSGKRFRNELYTYGEGTAVNITYSSDGQIAMELGGLDTSDRVPTSAETETLCASMEDFCDDFHEIEKRLLAKGVMVADRIAILPPEAEYAQIINTSDYSMSAEAERLHVRAQRRTTGDKKRMMEE